MKPKSTPTILVLCLLLAACVKEEYFRTQSWLVNRSAHRILITPYLRDSAYRFQTVTLQPGDSTRVYDGSGPGKDGATTWGYQLRNFDSLRIAYVDTSRTAPADTARIGHTRQGLTVTYPHVIPYTSPRSLYNSANWQTALNEESRYMRSNRYWYTFTEQDYRDAR